MKLPIVESPESIAWKRTSLASRSKYVVITETFESVEWRASQLAKKLSKVPFSTPDDVYKDESRVRPKTRGDCVDGERPCMWISCPHNLYLDVDGMNVRLNFPGLEPEHMRPEKSCSLDIADDGPQSLVDIANVLNISRERARQLEEQALTKVRLSNRAKHLKEHSREPWAAGRNVLDDHSDANE